MGFGDQILSFFNFIILTFSYFFMLLEQREAGLLLQLSE
ncbi:hypothetical protein D082_21050 [Synechocystis sp. PCC 6714]|nr:hypothetical protein D082_21050 [Synechocystis sp. PCC 6714]